MTDNKRNIVGLASAKVKQLQHQYGKNEQKLIRRLRSR
jgi:hypothetical protein